jgi:hypothetical protein
MVMGSVIVAAIALLASVLTASLSYWFAKKQQLRAEDRRLKEEYYRVFIKALSDVAIDNSDYEAQKRLSEGFNSLIVIGSPRVVERLMRFHDFARIENTSIARDSPEWSQRHDELLRDLVKEMRRDIYGEEKGVDEYISGVHLVGRGPKATS